MQNRMEIVNFGPISAGKERARRAYLRARNKAVEHREGRALTGDFRT